MAARSRSVSPLLFPRTLATSLALIVLPAPSVVSAANDPAPAPAQAASTPPAALPGAQWVEKANKSVAVTPGTTDIAPTLFPALAAMETPPAGLESLDAAMLLSTKSKSWPAASAWAAAAPQKAALEALTKVTDPKKKSLLGLPYGAAGVDPAWVKAGLYVELPADNLLHPMKLRYRKHMERLFTLVNVEATRLAAEGKPDLAMSECIKWVRLAKILVERETARERTWAIRQIMLACERIRDIAHTNRDALTAEMCRNTADDLDERLLQARRIRLPLVDRFSAEQVIARTTIEKGNVDAGKFASTLARIAVGERPLTLFGEAAWYRNLAGGHAGWFDTQDQLSKVFNGWANRWNVENLHDPLLQLPSDYAKMDKAKFALLEITCKEVEQMQALRLELLTATAGTRVALGAAGYERKEKRWPPNVSAVAPTYVRKLDEDPYGYDERFKNLNAFKYRVPIRDDPKREREDPRPHTMSVGIGEAAPSPAASDPLALSFASALAGAIKTGDGSSLSAEDLDFAGMLKNIENAKKQVIRRAGEVSMTDSQLSAMADAMKLSGSAGNEANAEMIRNLYTAGLKSAGPAGEALLGRINDMMGMTLDEYLAVIVSVENAALKNTAVQDLRRNAMGGTKLTLDMVKKASIGAAEALTSDTALFTRYLETMSKLMDAPLGAAIRQSAGLANPSAAESRFDVTVTEADFLLYSVGPDKRDDQARSVGSGGSDILLWPPLISLRREHAGQ